MQSARKFAVSLKNVVYDSRVKDQNWVMVEEKETALSNGNFLLNYFVLVICESRRRTPFLYWRLVSVYSTRYSNIQNTDSVCKNNGIIIAEIINDNNILTHLTHDRMNLN